MEAELEELATAPITASQALGEYLAAKAATTLDRIGLNVHVRNPAIRLYSRNGFEVAGKGRGPLGVAMLRHLRA